MACFENGHSVLLSWGRIDIPVVVNAKTLRKKKSHYWCMYCTTAILLLSGTAKPHSYIPRTCNTSTTINSVVRSPRTLDDMFLPLPRTTETHGAQQHNKSCHRTGVPPGKEDYRLLAIQMVAQRPQTISSSSPERR